MNSMKSCYRALVWFFAGVNSHVDEQFVSGVERATLATAVVPVTDVLVQRRRRVSTLIDVLFNVLNELVLCDEQLSAVQPQTDQRHVTAARLDAAT